jgi:predicted PurR-regulated permease PerM
MTPASPSSVTRADLYAWFFTVAALALMLVLNLLPALIAGLLVYELVHVLASRFGLRALGSERAKLVSVALIAGLVITLITLAIGGMVGFLRHGSDSLPALLQKLAEIIEATRGQLPEWLLQYIPADAEELRTTLAEWLRTHSSALPLAGKGLAITAAHILIGMVVGALLALEQPTPLEARRPVARAVAASAERLGDAFRRVVFAQAWIASINTVFTAIYLMVLLPLLGIHLPLVKTMIAVTLLAGLMPILGNLLSNSVIVLVSLSVSLPVAIGSLAFLIGVHKLEYFLNARIVGSHIRAQAWELLIAMLVMDAMFGIAGLIAAPIYYACIKDELFDKGLI